MMAFAKRDEPEQVLVPMIPGNRAAIRPGSPRAESPTTRWAAGEGCLTFYESCRSGNIGVAITPTEPSDREETGTAGRIPAASRYRPSPENAPQVAEELRPRPRVERPDVPAHGAPDSTLSEDELIGHIMAEDSQRPAAAAAAASPSPAMRRPRLDPQLSQLVDSWSNLSPAAREAIAAILDGGPRAAGCVPNAGARAGEAQRRKPPRAKDRAVPETAEPRRRRTRKTTTPRNPHP
jgi:hypothetical protein